MVSYDIGDNRSRRLAFKMLEGYGDPIEESVFECELSEAEFKKVAQGLEKLIDPEEDTCHLFATCKDCQRQALALGRGRRLSRRDFYIV
jgi:CRISPR-associated protein Cas2